MDNNNINISNNDPKKEELKWLKIKQLLMHKSILENSIKEIKKEKSDNFSSKLQEIYKEKINILLLIEQNKKLLSSWKKEEKNKNNTSLNHKEKNVIITSNLLELYSGSEEDIIKFMFYFRENHSAMNELINHIALEKRKDFAKFLCHFFYDKIFSDNKEDEIILFIEFLLEKEINNLLTPSSRDFLKDSFLKIFLLELNNNYEIRNYIDVVLNCLIRDIEDKNSFNCKINIIENSKIHRKYYSRENKFFQMDRQDSPFTDLSNEKNDNLFDEIINLKEKKKKSYSEQLKKAKTVNLDDWTFVEGFGTLNEKNINDLLPENFQIKNYIHEYFFMNINENYLRSLLYSEKNEIMKSFYIKQIKILNSSKNKNIFNCHDYFKRMVSENKISQLAVEQFNKMIEIIDNFLDKFLTNLENKEIIPFTIRMICLFINEKISKKFKNISKIMKNSLINKFLFGILIFPILENPDLCNSYGNMIISLNTRNILNNIYNVLSHLIEGELFNSNDNAFFTIFNHFIIKYYYRVNQIIDKILKNPIIIKNHAKEKELDSTEYKAICFNSNQFLLFYNTLHLYKKEILKGNGYIEDIYNKITEKIASIKFSINIYYLILKQINENDTIKNENKSKELNPTKNKNETYEKLKYSIEKVLQNFQMTFNLDNKLTTIKTFEIINSYLNSYFMKFFRYNEPPLKWYSQYIVNNLNSLNEEYKENDFQLLYNDIESEINNILGDNKKMKNYLNIDFITKKNYLDKLLKTYTNQLEKIRKTETNIKSLIFIESVEIQVCLITGFEYNKLIKSEKKLVNNKLLILSKTYYCIHNKITPSEKDKKFYDIKFHCNNVKEFAQKLSEYHKIVSDEIMNFSLGNEYYQLKDYKNTIKEKNDNNKDDDIQLNENNKIIASNSIKEILDTYMNYIKEILESDNEIISVFDFFSNNKKDEILNTIWNYILKSICDPISSEEPLFLDNIFKVRCSTLQKIVKPKNLNIPEEILDKKYIKKINENLKLIDELRTPAEIFNQFGLFIESINLLYKFFLKNIKVETDDLLNAIIYVILFYTPQRIIFKTNFCKFFLGNDELMGNIGINIAQIESSLAFINKLESNQIGISQQEFNDICSSINIK